MYKIEKVDYGFKLTFGDVIKPEEMLNWVNESKKVLLGASHSFGVLVDMRTLKPLSAEAQNYMHDGQKLYKQKGLTRSAVILANSVLKIQFKRLAQESGIYQWERYFDATADKNWESASVAWLKTGKDPDK
ncbi:MAG TPA: hypothetical protein PLE30_06340 [Candidatus Kapabacteria bacterium]|nr:hypothetical protein [Candidatus Kapabacteria bacterium]